MRRKIDYKNFIEKSVEFTKNYLLNNHLEGCVIGCSGGIDSTVSACILSIACKESGKKLIGRSLPTSTNKDEEFRSALLVGQAFCDDFKEVNIESMTNLVVNELVSNEGDITRLQKGNVKARLRMIYLYNLASLNNSIVISNSNLSEILLGFFTIAGDIGDYNIGLKYLYKTEVYELAKYLLSTYKKDSPEYLALEASIGLTPTDGNGVSKSDCEQFGLDNYEQVDDILRTMYGDNWYSEDDYTRLIDTYNEQGVDKIMLLHQKTEYKRKPSPIMPNMEDVMYFV